MKQQRMDIQQLKQTTGNDLEASVQKRCEEYLDYRGHIHGRVKQQGTYDEKIKCRRKNPQLFLGLPDILVFKKSEGMFNIKWWAYAIECKRERGGKGQSPHQKQFQKWWEASRNIYVLARGTKDLQEAGL